MHLFIKIVYPRKQIINAIPSTIFLLKVTWLKSTPSPGTNSELHISGAFGEDLIMSWVINIRKPLRRFCCPENKSYRRQLSPQVIGKKMAGNKGEDSGSL